MRIARPDNKALASSMFSGQLLSILETAINDKRICNFTCHRPCPTHNSTTCACGCVGTCPDAAAQLSSEGEAYPLEPGVVALVLSLKKLRVVRPTWSCEGHNDRMGKLWKTPKVWFACDSVIPIRLIGEGVRQLKTQGRLKAHWDVRLSYSDGDNPDTTFSLEPMMEMTPSATLRDLQADLRVLGEQLYDQVLLRACQLYADAN